MLTISGFEKDSKTLSECCAGYKRTFSKGALANELGNKVEKFRAGRLGDFLSKLNIELGEIDEASPNEEGGNGDIQFSLSIS